jgi:hypothetical protein
MATQFREGTLVIPPPAVRVEHWPITGASVNKLWSLAATDLGQAVRSFAPETKAVMPSVFVHGVGRIRIHHAAVPAFDTGRRALLAKAQAAYEVTCLLAKRLFGKEGPEFRQIIGATIRSVTTGILGVAFNPSVLAGLAFLVVGLPGAGRWVVFLIAAVLQVGMLVLIPAVAYVFAVSSVTKAVIFQIWCAIVVVFLGAMEDSSPWELSGCSLVQLCCPQLISCSLRGSTRVP